MAAPLAQVYGACQLELDNWGKYGNKQNDIFITYIKLGGLSSFTTHIKRNSRMHYGARKKE